jgi:hypothetical protein
MEGSSSIRETPATAIGKRNSHVTEIFIYRGPRKAVVSPAPRGRGRHAANQHGRLASLSGLDRPQVRSFRSSRRVNKELRQSGKLTLRAAGLGRDRPDQRPRRTRPQHELHLARRALQPDDPNVYEGVRPLGVGLFGAVGPSLLAPTEIVVAHAPFLQNGSTSSLLAKAIAQIGTRSAYSSPSSVKLFEHRGIDSDKKGVCSGQSLNVRTDRISALRRSRRVRPPRSDDVQ